MAFRIKSAESAADELRRVAREELEYAGQQLEKARASTRDEAIHDARKCIKKTRAIVRLISPKLKGAYRLENRRLRELGRRLSEFRDAAVLVEVFDQLKERYQEELGSTTLGSIRRALLSARRMQARGPGVRVVTRRVATALEREASRVPKWAIEGEGWGAIADGMKAGYSQGRKAMREVRSHNRPEYCHEWRKRVKDHWYHTRLLESLWTEEMEAREKSLKELETWLGDHHNLEILHERIGSSPAEFGSPEDVNRCLKLIRKYQKDLRRDALSLGERLYAEPVSAFLKRMKDFWDAWRTQAG